MGFRHEPNLAAETAIECERCDTMERFNAVYIELCGYVREVAVWVRAAIAAAELGD